MGGETSQASFVVDAAEPGEAEPRRMRSGEATGACVRVDSPEAEARASALIGSVGWLCVDDADAPFMRAENLISKLDGTPTRLACCVRDADDVGGLAFALGRGVDALVCAAEDLVGSKVPPSNPRRALSRAVRGSS